MKKLPLARTAEIVVQTLGKEVLVYDLRSHQAYNLNETAAAVYQACDGRTTFDELKKKHKFTDDLIYLALDQLRDDKLIETDASFASPFGNVSRREAIKKVGLASLVALPLISSLAAPSSAHASSLTDFLCATPGGQTCTTQPECSAYCQTALNNSCACISNCCVECPIPTTACNFICVNTQVDPNNCGSCGNVCTLPEVCFNGSCQIVGV
jgi:hypothetical protein